MNGDRCRSCGCITSADSSACPGQLGLGGTCRCHRVGATYEPVTPSGPPSLVGIESARVTYLDDDGHPVANTVITGPAVIETWERKFDGGIVRDSIRVRPWATVPRAALPSGGPRLPPNEVAPQLLANVRERGDNWGDLANATADELRDALQLAARQLNSSETEVARMRWVMARRFVDDETLLELYDRLNPAWVDWSIEVESIPWDTDRRPPPPMYLTRVDPEPNAG